jgi:hypothetical protein
LSVTLSQAVRTILEADIRADGNNPTLLDMPSGRHNTINQSTFSELATLGLNVRWDSGIAPAVGTSHIVWTRIAQTFQVRTTDGTEICEESGTPSTHAAGTTYLAAADFDTRASVDYFGSSGFKVKIDFGVRVIDLVENLTVIDSPTPSPTGAVTCLLPADSLPAASQLLEKQVVEYVLGLVWTRSLE